MKREIKFRVWYNLSEVMRSFDIKGMSELDLYEDDFEVMQYTGLKDKNGTEIYEGDIITFHAFTNGGGQSGYSEVDYEGKAEVFYEPRSLSFMFKVREDEIWDVHGTSHYETGECLEVIGNIYEHPQSLKG